VSVFITVVPIVIAHFVARNLLTYRKRKGEDGEHHETQMKKQVLLLKQNETMR